jgi:hypothetical protein
VLARLCSRRRSDGSAHIAASYIPDIAAGCVLVSSDEAKAAACAVGMELQQGETWVRLHARGLPDDAELQFSWRIPKKLSID